MTVTAVPPSPQPLKSFNYKPYLIGAGVLLVILIIISPKKKELENGSEGSRRKRPIGASGDKK